MNTRATARESSLLARAGRRVAVLVTVGALFAAALPALAEGSELIARNAARPGLAVTADNVAVITYRAAGRERRVLAWGAVNALPSTAGRKQVAFGLDYSGGWRSGKLRAGAYENRCRPYDGPPLAWLVTACKAPDGSYWALQRWQRMLPNYGVAASRQRRAYELRLSHWTGPLPTLEVWQDWVFYGSRSYQHLFGRYTYRGRPVYGFRAARSGRPLDTWGRNVYLDTLNSAYGRGWRRENSFLTHRTGGNFCYGLFTHGDRPRGTGERYRLTVIGPGVTPDVKWEAPALGDYDAGNAAHVAHEQRMRVLEHELAAGDGLCRQR